MRMRIVTPYSELGEEIARSLEAGGLDEVEVVEEPAERVGLRLTAGADLEQVQRALEILRPMTPAVRTSEEVDGADVELAIGFGSDLDDWSVRIHAENAPAAQSLTDAIGALGFSMSSAETEEIEKERLRYGGAPAALRQFLHWRMGLLGVRLEEEKAWNDSDHDIWIYVREQAVTTVGPGGPARVIIESDDLAMGLALREQVAALDVSDIAYQTLERSGTWGRRFGVDARLFRAGGRAEDGERLVAQLEDLLRGWGVDLERYPVEALDPPGFPTAIRVSLPVMAFRRGELRPYGSDGRERYAVSIVTDDPPRAEGLRERLEEVGFEEVAVTDEGAGRLTGFGVRWNAAADDAGVAELVPELVRDAVASIDAGPGVSVVRPSRDAGLDLDVVIELPALAAEDGSLILRIGALARPHSLTVKAPSTPEVEAFVARMKEFGFGSVSHSEESWREAPLVNYGSAKASLIGLVAAELGAQCGAEAELTKGFSDDDHDVWLSLSEPEGGAQAAAVLPEAAVDFDAWLSEGRADGGSDGGAEGFIDVQASEVRVGQRRLTRWRGGHEALVPRVGDFEHYCVDRHTAATLEHLATCVALREPCLLEGATSTSKTSSIQYLASLLGQPVVRLNLNGQTDTGEFIGRYVPQSLSHELPYSIEDLSENTELLEPESQLILQRAAREERALTPIEVQQLMHNEGMRTRAWRWQDGLVVQALRHGWWVILDELNLAEPQILERLNSVLERSPTLVLTEHDNSVFGPGGHAIHPGFRVFGTMNPADYAGRSTLSPAYRDRWLGYRFVPTPGEGEYLAMLRFLVHGPQPDISVAGQRYDGGRDGDPYLGVLARLPWIDGFVRAFARFHAALQAAVSPDAGGLRRLGHGTREPYVVSRRGMLAAMEYLAHAVEGADGAGPDALVRAVRTALYRYYVARMRTDRDRGVVASLLDAAGIGPGTWQPGGGDGDAV